MTPPADSSPSLAAPQMRTDGDADGPRTLRYVVVVAGPSHVGKSTLIASLLRGDMPRLAAALGMDPKEYSLVRASEWRRLTQTSCKAVLLHYDLTRKPFLVHGTMDGALGVLNGAQTVSFLTLWAPPEELARRFDSEFRAGIAADLRRLQIRRARRTFHNYRVRRPVFKTPDLMWGLYERWFDFTRRFDRSLHWVMRCSSLDSHDRLPSPLSRTLLGRGESFAIGGDIRPPDRVCWLNHREARSSLRASGPP